MIKARRIVVLFSFLFFMIIGPSFTILLSNTEIDEEDTNLVISAPSDQYKISEEYDEHDWPMFQLDRNHSGFTTSPGPTTNRTIATLAIWCAL